MRTAFVILSNIELNDSLSDRIKKDYAKEDDATKKFLYEFLLAKRLQENQYILNFIKNAKTNLSIFLNDDSNWVSITSPILELISIYSTTNDEALGVLLSLSVGADGAVQSAISSSLRDVYENKPERLIEIVNSMKLDLNEVLLLMEYE